LTAKGVQFEGINYIDKPLSTAELKRLIHIAGLRPRDVIRTNEVAYQQHVAGQSLSDEQLVRVMAEHPELIQRPIVMRGNKAVLARPVDNLAELGIK
jgi:arsenate reductase